MEKTYWRPILQTDAVRPENAIQFLGGNAWFTHLEAITRTSSRLVDAQDAPPDQIAIFPGARELFEKELKAPQIMGILNVTPDSFSDGGKHLSLSNAVDHACQMIDDGADIIDIGGESTRPGADFVSSAEEIDRTVPVIEALRSSGVTTPISIDTRKADVARAAVLAGATLFNDVSALSFDAESLRTAAELGVPVCLMHASGDPKTMQENPEYENVVLDVYDYLESRKLAAIDAGIEAKNILLDPGVGFGKTTAHNLELLRKLSLFNGLGCPVLLGTSRKRFIGELTKSPDASQRAPGSIATALAAIAQGVQIFRVHDVAETSQAITIWRHLHGN